MREEQIPAASVLQRCHSEIQRYRAANTPCKPAAFVCTNRRGSGVLPKRTYRTRARQPHILARRRLANGRARYTESDRDAKRHGTDRGLRRRSAKAATLRDRADRWACRPKSCPPPPV